MTGPIDVLPALLLPAFVLLALAVFMPITGARAVRRREAWARFESVARIRGIAGAERAALARWAQLSSPNNPHYVIVRRKDFDRFSRSEVQRLRGLGAEAFALGVEALGRLREKLGFAHATGTAQSSHDLTPGEQLVIRHDDGRRASMCVVGVDEEGVHVDSSSLQRLGAGWATFARDGQGHYRFRTSGLRKGVLSHGTFLVHEERRRDPRVRLRAEPFWIAVERLPDGAAPEDPEGVEVEVLDVSTGGVALLADRVVRKGSEVWMDLPLGNGPESPKVRGVRARVLGHGYREGGGQRPHFINCSFLDMADPPRRVLEAFVFSRTPADAS